MANEEIVVIDPVTVVETPVVETPIEPVEAPVEPVVEAPVLEQKIYEYQPTDEDGRPMGGKQVIKYTTPEELTEKLTKNSVELLRKLRKETRKVRLGISDVDTIDEAAQRFQGPIEFKPRELSGEDRYKLSQDILDPDNFDSAINTIFEATSGIAAADLRNVITTLQTDNESIKAAREVDKFIHNNPDYVKCQENSEALMAWINRYGLAPVVSNFQKAYDTLKAADVLVTSTEIVRPTPIAEPVVEVVDPPAREEIPVENQIEPVVPPVVESPVASRVPTGLHKSNSSDVGHVAALGDDIVYEYVQRDSAGRQVGQARVFKGMAAITAMPSEEYKRRILHEKGFAKRVEKLEAEAAAKRRQG